MTNIASLFVCLLLLIVFAASVQPVQAAPEILSHMWCPASLATPAGFKCKKIEGKLVCGGFGKSGKNDKDGDDDDKAKKSEPFTCKKAKCDPGEVKLDKPNIYGACCQATAAPLTPKTEKEKCKFPGELGEPPNCFCPEGTEFLGYKGCVRVHYGTTCGTGYISGPEAAFKTEQEWTANARKDCDWREGVISFTCSYPAPDKKRCCCETKTFD